MTSSKSVQHQISENLRARPPGAVSADLEWEKKYPAPRKRLAVSYRAIPTIAVALDIIFIAAAGLLSASVYHEVVFRVASNLRRDTAMVVFVSIVFVLLASAQKLYSAHNLLLWNLQTNNVVWIWCATFFLATAWLFLWGAGDDVSRGAILTFWLGGLFVLLGQRAAWRIFLEWALKRRSLIGRQVVVVSRDQSGRTPKFPFARFGYEVRFNVLLSGDAEEHINRATDKVVSLVRGSDIEEILLLTNDQDFTSLKYIALRLRLLPVPVTWMTSGTFAELLRHAYADLGPVVAVEMQRPPLSSVEQALKRFIDIVFSVLGLLMFSPLFVAVAVAIKLESSGPLLFFQKRHGFNGKSFYIVKFRSMNVLEDGSKVRQVTRGDQRVTRVGKWIRALSIDELPQFLNVLRGEMSLVGPRPHASVHDSAFAETVENYAYRQNVKPGITGWAQVHGYRGETSTPDQIKGRVERDLWYINNWSIALDFSIMLRTPFAITRIKDVY